MDGAGSALHRGSGPHPKLCRARARTGAEPAAAGLEPQMKPRLAVDDFTEWLESDGQGGFASGTSSGVRTRRYHALLLTATTPPTGRMVLVNGLDAWLENRERSAVSTEREYLSRQRYAPGVVVPAGAAAVESFENDPWPTWVYRL